MRLTVTSGLWSTGVAPAPGPLALVLEVSGAVLSWSLDGRITDPPVLTFTDHRRADWLWRVFGAAGHVALDAALDSGIDAATIEVPDVSLLRGAADTLRRLAFGHWLRRWWPAGERDAIVPLDAAVLDAELAILTVAAEDFFTDDTFDADVAGLLAPHVAALEMAAVHGDARVTALIEQCRELAADIGLDWVVDTDRTVRRDDYALAASGGSGGAADPAVIASGVASVPWSTVPPGIFDASEGTLDWSVRVIDGDVNVVVQGAISGPNQPAGIEVAVYRGSWRGFGEFDAAGRATLPIRDADDEPIGEGPAWNADWAVAEVVVGAGTAESGDVRAWVRAFARDRLASPGADAFLAELLAADADY